MTYTEEAFVVDNDQKAEWALKKILAAQRERDRLLELIEAEQTALDVKKLETQNRYESDTAFLLSQLNNYLDTVERKKTKTQETYQLLSGRLVRKFPKQKLVPDKAALLDFCKTHAPEYVKHTEEAMWGEIKDSFAMVDGGVVFANTGELVDFIAVEDVPAVLSVDEK